MKRIRAVKKMKAKIFLAFIVFTGAAKKLIYDDRNFCGFACRN